MKQQKSSGANSRSTVEFQQVIERGAAIDVHKNKLVASVQGTGIKSETRVYTAFTSDIEQMRTWFKSLEIAHVAMESTGVYWKPVFNLLESHFKVILVNPQKVKAIPGHKTDKRDSKRLVKYLLSGLLDKSFIPARHVRELRDLTRYRQKIVGQISSEKNRVHKMLEDGNIKLSSVVSNLSGVTATKIIDAMINGESDVKELVKLRHGKMKATVSNLAGALQGNLTPHHRLMLKMFKKSIADKEELLSEIDAEIKKLEDAQEMTQDVERLCTMPGIDKTSASCILSEIGNDMSEFETEHHLTSWAGMSPGNNESAGKKKVVKSRTETST